MPRLSLVARFSLVGALVSLVLALGVAAILEGRIEARTLREGERLAEVLARVGVEAELAPSDLEQALPASRLDALDRRFGQATLRDAGLERVKVFAVDGRIAYADERRLVGEVERDAGGLAEALAGRRFAELEHGTRDDGTGREVLEVYLPLRWSSTGPPAGAVEVYLDYEPLAAALGRDVRAVYGLFLVAAFGGFATMFRIVWGASRRLSHLAVHDELTGLPNRSLLYDRLERAIARVPRGESAALLLLDLDRFKEVNDTLGHDQGDRLLVEVAERLRRVLRRDDTLARLGGDEFAVLLPDVAQRGVVAELAARLHDALHRPFLLDGMAVELGVSVGIAYCPEHGDAVSTLLRRADVAMYAAKRARTGVETYAAERDPYSPERLALVGELRRAIPGGELELHYQPKVSVASGAVEGFEALVRWRHPERGLLGPVEFIGLAERSGMIGELTRWVLDAALAQCRRWRDQELDLPVAVNLSAASIADVSLPDTVAERLAVHRLPGESLVCEISEYTVMAEPERALDVLSRVRALGVRLSLDDFGTGNASLAYLKRLPLDEVKIDRSFVGGMVEDEEDAVIVRATIDLARNLGLTVVAEGVETAEVIALLDELRCDTAQGYHLSRPLTVDALAPWLAGRAVNAL